MRKLIFSAEASLYEARSVYATAVPYSREDRQPGTVQPASVLDCVRSCGQDEECRHCCICIARGGDPSNCCY
jgi:hypothetical protein